MFRHKNVGAGRICLPHQGWVCGEREHLYTYIYIFIYFLYYLYISHMFYIVLQLFYDFSTFIRPYMGTNYVHEPSFNFLEMAHTKLLSSIRKQYISPWLELKMTTIMRSQPQTFQQKKKNRIRIFHIIYKSKLYIFYMLRATQLLKSYLWISSWKCLLFIHRLAQSDDRNAAINS